MYKVATIIGTRPELIRLSSTIGELDRFFEHIMIHTGQNYDRELNEIFYEDLNIRKPDIYLNSAGKSAIETISNILVKVEKILIEENPDAVVILGDTNSALSAIVAKRYQIPIFHIEAGNRCFDFRVPEEINRRIVDSISDVNITYSKLAKSNLLGEGFDPQRLVALGSPMREVLQGQQNKIRRSKIIDLLGLEAGRFFLMSFHREENVDNPTSLNKVVTICNQLVLDFDVPVVISMHPRTRDRVLSSGLEFLDRVITSKPFCYSDYMRLQIDARCVLSDSGTLVEEASIAGFSAIGLRDVTERGEGLENGGVILTGLEYEKIKTAIEMVDEFNLSGRDFFSTAPDYDCQNFSKKFSRLLLSSLALINRVVWSKE